MPASAQASTITVQASSASVGSRCLANVRLGDAGDGGGVLEADCRAHRTILLVRAAGSVRTDPLAPAHAPAATVAR